jgi:hypothetical protein
MLKHGVIVVAVMVLAGCASEVDKCVEANIKARLMKLPNHTEKDKVQVEALARLACLQANGGRNN